MVKLEPELDQNLEKERLKVITKRVRETPSSKELIQVSLYIPHDLLIKIDQQVSYAYPKSRSSWILDCAREKLNNI